MATEKTIQNALKALPHLVARAETRDVITYGRLAEQMGVHHRVVPRCLGYIREEVCLRRGLPEINSIVVGARSKLPGKSFLSGGTAHLTKNEFLQKFEERRDEVFTYGKWRQLLTDLGLSAVASDPQGLEQAGSEYAQYLERHAGIGEGERHRRLKEYVRDHPELLNIAARHRGKTEHLFPSGDRCDVIFELEERGAAVVEIKKGDSLGELAMGVYQAVKYRALMAAVRGNGQQYPVEAHLAAYAIPDDIARLAKRLGIQCHVVVVEP